MTMAENGFAAFREPVGRRAFAPGFELWLRLEAPLERLWRGLLHLPDRGPAATPDDVPPEFYRFPCF